MSDFAERLTAALAKHAPVAAAEDAPDDAPDDAAPDEADEAAPDEGEADEAEEAAPDVPAPTPEVPKDDTAARIAARNRELASELEALKAKVPKGTAALASQAASMYLQDPMQAMRMLVAAGLGIEDAASKDVDAELEGLLLEAAGKDLGVPLDPTKKLEHGQRRLNHMLRMQQAEKVQPVDDGTAARLETIERTASPMLDKYPHARDLHGILDGKPIKEIVNQAILIGLASGELDPKMTNEALVASALGAIDAHYKQLADRIAASSKPAAAPPSASEKQGTRTVTSSNASVAPTKAPIKKQKPKVEEYADEEARRKSVFARHFS